MQNHWTAEEIALLRANATTSTRLQLAVLIPRHTARSIERKAQRLGLGSTHKPWTFDEEATLYALADTLPPAPSALEFWAQAEPRLPGRKASAIREKAHTLGLSADVLRLVDCPCGQTFAAGRRRDGTVSDRCPACRPRPKRKPAEERPCSAGCGATVVSRKPAKCSRCGVLSTCKPSTCDRCGKAFQTRQSHPATRCRSCRHALHQTAHPRKRSRRASPDRS